MRWVVPCLLFGLLMAAGMAPTPASAVVEPPHDGWHRLWHDCDADHGGLGDDGYDLVALDVQEGRRGSRDLVVFALTLDGRGLFESGRAGFTLRFAADDEAFVTTMASDDDIAFAHDSGVTLSHVATLDASTNDAPNRVTVEMGYQYGSLGQLRDGQAIDGARVTAWTGQPSTTGDLLHACPAAADDAARTQGAPYTVTASDLPNRPPAPTISWSPLNATTRDLVMLNGSAMDPDGDAVATWAWTWKTDATGAGTASDRQRPVYRWTSAGTYAITLTVTDALGASGVAETTITIGNGRPEAHIGAPTAADVRDSIQFRGDGSHDADGNITAWIWDFDDGLTSRERNPTHAYGEPGNYTVKLEVIDNHGSRDTAFHVLRVRGDDERPDASPVADFRVLPTPAYAGQELSFYDQSTDVEDGTPITWLWDFGDQRFSEAADARHTYDRSGRYNVTLTVSDTAGNFAQASRQVVVLDPGNAPRDLANEPPEASFRVIPLTGIAGQPLQFQDTSHDPDGEVIDRSWSFGDGTGAVTAADTTHVFEVAGDYLVTLTVVDNGGAVGNVSRLVIVDGVAAAPDDNDTDGGSGRRWIPGPPMVGWLAAVAVAGAWRRRNGFKAPGPVP